MTKYILITIVLLKTIPFMKYKKSQNQHYSQLLFKKSLKTSSFVIIAGINGVKKVENQSYIEGHERPQKIILFPFSPRPNKIISYCIFMTFLNRPNRDLQCYLVQKCHQSDKCPFKHSWNNSHENPIIDILLFNLSETVLSAFNAFMNQV